MIDTHCHLDVAAFDGDRDDAIARATAAGVAGMVIPAIRPRTWPALIDLARRHAAAGVRHAIGIHPQIVPELDAAECCGVRSAGLAEGLERRLVEAAGDAIAIGECGLDGATTEPALQEAIFRAHIRAARALGKPLVVHVVRAHDRAPRILREERTAGGVLHSYSGGPALVPVYRDLGFAFSFAGPITYPNARKPVEAARAVPAELLVAETDAPDQAPAAHRGRRSEPAYLGSVIAGLATARAADAADVARLTAANARRIFRAWDSGNL